MQSAIACQSVKIAAFTLASPVSVASTCVVLFPGRSGETIRSIRRTIVGSASNATSFASTISAIESPCASPNFNNSSALENMYGTSRFFAPPSADANSSADKINPPPTE